MEASGSVTMYIFFDESGGMGLMSKFIFWNLTWSVSVSKGQYEGGW